MWSCIHRPGAPLFNLFLFCFFLSLHFHLILVCLFFPVLLTDTSLFIFSSHFVWRSLFPWKLCCFFVCCSSRSTPVDPLTNTGALHVRETMNCGISRRKWHALHWNVVTPVRLLSSSEQISLFSFRFEWCVAYKKNERGRLYRSTLVGRVGDPPF